MMRTGTGRIRTILVGTALVGAAVVPVAGAGASVTSGAACPERELAPTFAPFLDPNSYFALPGGDFEHGTGDWSLRGGARVEGGINQTLLDVAGGGDDSHALVLPAGSSARAATLCVSGTAPVMRFFVATKGLLGALAVTVTATDEAGDTQVLVTPALSILPGWTAPMVLFRLPWLGDHLTQVTIELRSVGWSPVVVDDIYVDPLRQR